MVGWSEVFSVTGFQVVDRIFSVRLEGWIEILLADI